MPNDPKVVAVVDDDEPACRALARLLRSAGFAVETFTGGLEFFESLAGPGSREPDCLVLDLGMPGMDGLEVLARLTASGRRVPVVVVTGVETQGIRLRAMRAGASAFLRKPVVDQVLLDAVSAAVNPLRG